LSYAFIRYVFMLVFIVIITVVDDSVNVQKPNKKILIFLILFLSQVSSVTPGAPLITPEMVS